MKRTAITVCAFAMLSLTCVQAALCQELASLRTGESVRVQISPPATQRIQGRIVSLSADTIMLRAPTNALSIPFSEISLLEVKRRTGGSVMKSVALGLIGGAIAGAILGAASGNTNTGDGILRASDKALIGSLAGGGIGLIGGTVFGACCSSAWEAVPLPRGM